MTTPIPPPNADAPYEERLAWFRGYILLPVVAPLPPNWPDDGYIRHLEEVRQSLGIREALTAIITELGGWYFIRKRKERDVARSR
jgi:hypothetical protein